MAKKLLLVLIHHLKFPRAGDRPDSGSITKRGVPWISANDRRFIGD
jgi:hypothetical protein